MIRISVLVPALLGTEHVAGLLRTLQAQTARQTLELLILCPDSTLWRSLSLHPNDRLVEVGDLPLHEARSRGVEVARGDWILVAEDHCFPDPDWAEMVLSEAEGPWDAIGPAIAPGNPRTALARSLFLLGYGEWFEPLRSGPVDYVCGCNCILRRSALHKFSDGLAKELLLPAHLQRQLKAQGSRFFLESRARMRHFDPSLWMGGLITVFTAGLGWGAQRSRNWNRPLQLAYALAVPLIAALHFRRAWRQYFGRARALGPSALMLALPLALVWALGEAAGSLLGAKWAGPWVSYSELGRWAFVAPQDLPD